MVFAGWGDMGLGSLQAGVGSALDAFKQASAQRQLEALGQQIRAGDIDGALQSSLSVDPSGGMMLKLMGMKQQQESSKAFSAGLSGLYGDSTAPAAPGGLPPANPAAPARTSALSNMGSMSYAGAAVPPAIGGDVMAYAPAISGNEGTTGSGGYSQTGIVIPKTGDQAYGKYQVMGANIGPWTQEILGRSMTPQEFLASPEAQDAVFRGKFGQYTQKYGPEGAARAWFAGERGMNNPNAVDPLGTTVSSYAAGFNRRLGSPPDATAAIQVAMKGRTPASDTPDTPGVEATPDAIRSLPQPVAAGIAATNPMTSQRVQTLLRLSTLPALTDPQKNTISLLLKHEMDGMNMPESVKKYLFAKTPAGGSFTGSLKEFEDKSKDTEPLSKREYDLAQSDPKYAAWLKAKEDAKHPEKLDTFTKRMNDLQQGGVDPDSPEGHFYLYNGKMPENLTEMKQGEQKQYETQAARVNTLKSSIGDLKEALKLNDQAYSGRVEPFVAPEVTRNLPPAIADRIVDPKRVVATTQFQNTIQRATMGMGKEMVGARVTNYEEQQVQKLKANPFMSPAERESIIQSLIANREEGMKEAQAIMDQIKGGSRYKKGTSAPEPAPAPAAPPAAPPAVTAPPAAAAPVRVSTPQEAAQLPAGTRFIGPDGQIRVRH
jgi:hypothetical protein